MDIIERNWCNCLLAEPAKPKPTSPKRDTKAKGFSNGDEEGVREVIEARASEEIGFQI